MQFCIPPFDKETYEMLKWLKHHYFSTFPLQLPAGMQNLHTLTKAIRLLYETEAGTTVVPGFEKKPNSGAESIPVDNKDNKKPY
jgi:hypothetical protein